MQGELWIDSYIVQKEFGTYWIFGKDGWPCGQTTYNAEILCHTVRVGHLVMTGVLDTVVVFRQSLHLGFKFASFSLLLQAAFTRNQILTVVVSLSSQLAYAAELSSLGSSCIYQCI